MKKVNAADYAETIVKAIPKGVLVTTKADKVNSMVIGWGTFGVEWGTQMFVIYIREGRFTRQQLDKNPEFTVNIPLDGYDKKIFKVCGTESGHQVDKVKEAGLTLVEDEDFSVPGVKELPLTLECRVVFRQRQEIDLIDSQFDGFYPPDKDSTVCGANKDAHIAYYGEIVDTYIIED